MSYRASSICAAKASISIEFLNRLILAFYNYNTKENKNSTEQTFCDIYWHLSYLPYWIIFETAPLFAIRVPVLKQLSQKGKYEFHSFTNLIDIFKYILSSGNYIKCNIKWSNIDFYLKELNN